MPQRLLRPGLTNSERWNAVPFKAQSLFIRLLTIVDDFGQCDARPPVLHATCFAIWNAQNPADPISIDELQVLLQQLAASQLIFRGECQGKKFLQVVQWQERIRDGCRRKFPEITADLQQVAASCSNLLPPTSPSPSPYLGMNKNPLRREGTVPQPTARSGSVSVSPSLAQVPKNKPEAPGANGAPPRKVNLDKVSDSVLVISQKEELKRVEARLEKLRTCKPWDAVEKAEVDRLKLRKKLLTDSLGYAV